MAVAVRANRKFMPHDGLRRHRAAGLAHALTLAWLVASVLVTAAQAGTLVQPPLVWNRLLPSTAAPYPRQEYSLVRDTKRNRLVMYGGWHGVYESQVWTLSLSGPPVWQLLSPGGDPAVPRASHTAIYDPVRDGMWVFGGSDGTQYRNDVQFLSFTGPVEWHNIVTASPEPSPCRSHSAIYDPYADRMVVFGGYPFLSDEVWFLSLAGTPAWSSPAIPAPRPAGRQSALAVLDPTTQSLLLFGGEDGFQDRNDVWRLSLTGTPGWTQELPVGGPPAARRLFAGDFDTQHNQLLIHGGQGSGEMFSDVWSLSRGVSPQWTDVTPSTPPAMGERANHSAVYDPVLDRLVLFGGSTTQDFHSDLWELKSQCVPATVTATATAGGSITPSGAISVNCGANQTFTITPDPCRVIHSVLVDGVPVAGMPAYGGGSYSFTDVHAAHTISVTFTAPLAAAPPRLEAWWSFDDLVPNSTDQLDLVHRTGTLFTGANRGSITGGGTLIPGKVGQALRCAAPASGIQVLQHNGTIYVGNCGFGIEGWIRLDPGAPASAERPIAELDQMKFHVKNGQLGLNQMVTSMNPPLSAGVWHHVAVSTISQCAAGAQTSFYVDGVRVQTIVNQSVVGDEPVSVYLGRTATPTVAFGGELDEVSFFRASIRGAAGDSAVIRKIWAAGCAGKRREILRVPLWVQLPAAPNSSRDVCAVFTNLTSGTQSYSWNWQPIDAACSGNVTVNPASGGVANVAPFTAQTANLQFRRVGNGNACFYQLSATNTATQQTLFTEGGVNPNGQSATWVVFSSNSPHCQIPVRPGDASYSPGPAGDGAPNVTVGSGTFDVQNDSTGAVTLDYRIVALEPETMEPSEDIALGDRPPGQPYLGSVTVPANSTVPISVAVSVETNNPLRTDQLVLYADLDGDAVMEPHAAALIEAIEDTTGGSLDVGDDGTRPGAISAVPNPFRGRVSVDFTLPQSGRVEVAVFDVAGRRARSLVTGQLEAGPHHLEWDGRDANSRPAGAGIYFVRILAGGRRLQTRVVQLR